MNDQAIWRHCGSCKKAISLKSKYYACAISTCKKSAYCSMPCFDNHTPIFRHKDAWAEERFAPSVLDLNEDQPISRLANPHTNLVKKSPNPTLISPSGASSSASSAELPKDILVVASKLKEYVRVKSGMNTSASVLDRLSDMLRIHCDKAIERAHSDNRKTIMDRDFHL